MITDFKWVIITLLGLALIFAFFLDNGEANTLTKMDRAMPEFALPMLTIPEATVSDWDFKGQVTLLNVFSSRCESCVPENILFMGFAHQQNIQLLGLNWRDTPEAATNWLEQHGDPYMKTAFDDENELITLLGVTGDQETFIVDTTGQIRFKQVGPITQEIWQQSILPALETLAKEQYHLPE
jgi:cytochrome c biogenesis protein CcmG/thiol:disulfide interchange protein DsbE